MKFSSVALCVCLLEVTMLGAGEIYSSMAKLKMLPTIEKKLLGMFDELLVSDSGHFPTQELKRKILTLKKENERALLNLDVVESPLLSFRMIIRLVKGWNSVFKDLDKLAPSLDTRVAESVTSTRQWLAEQNRWPSQIDIDGAAMALVRLHNIYNLGYNATIQGSFLNVTSQPLSVSELAYITQSALKLGLICDTKQLCSSLAAMTSHSNGPMPATVGKLKKRLSQVAIDVMTECDKNDSLVEITKDLLPSIPKTEVKNAVRSLYHNMCRKSLRVDIVYGTGRTCYWHITAIPYLKFKAEIVNSDPPITVFYDIIKDDEINEIKEIAYGMLSPSTLAVAQVAHEQKLVRISQSAWLFDTTPVLVRISKRVELVTGLSTRIEHENTHAEPYQVLNYGLGGVYGPHEDSVRIPRHRGSEDIPLLKNSGDRTATWMYYLSDVPLGGATVFPVLGAGIRPIKGSAAFWYNLKRNGEADIRMVHAGCPVLYGDKWVANKWLREIGNIFRRPCLTDPFQ